MRHRLPQLPRPAPPLLVCTGLRAPQAGLPHQRHVSEAGESTRGAVRGETPDAREGEGRRLGANTAGRGCCCRTRPPPASAPRTAEAQPHPAPRLRSAPHRPALSRVCSVLVTSSVLSVAGRGGGSGEGSALGDHGQVAALPGVTGDAGTRLALPVSRPRPRLPPLSTAVRYTLGAVL